MNPRRDELSLEEDYYSVSIPLFTDQLGDNLGSGLAEQMNHRSQYTVPAQFKLLVTGLSGYTAFDWAGTRVGPVVTGDAAALGNGAGVGSYMTKQTFGMFLGRAMSMAISLRHTRSGYKIIEGDRKLNLAALLMGRPVDWSKRPHIVPTGETLELEIDVLDTTLNAVDGTTGPLMAGDRRAAPGFATDQKAFFQAGVVVHGHLLRVGG